MVAVSIVILGIIGLISLPIEQYPDIAPPTVKVSASYTGASAETVMKSVVVPLESSINGVENMQYGYGRPSFFGLYLGFNVPLSHFDVSEDVEYQTSMGTTLCLEGAYFFLTSSMRHPKL